MPDNSVNILLVDDRPENLLALEAVLGDLGETLVRAGSGEEALRRVLEADYAVILLDVNMPGVSGFEVAKLVRGRERSRHTPIIFLTAGASDDFPLEEAYALGAVDYLVKPFVPVALRAKVGVFVELARRTREAREAERRLAWRTTLASIGDGVVVTDPVGRVTFLNPVAEALTGWPTDDARGRPLTEVFRIVNETSRREVENPALRAIETGFIVGLANHTVLIARDGVERPIDDSASPVRAEDGTLTGAVLVFRDISERRKAEIAQARLAAIVESSDDAIIGKSLDGVIQSWNAGAERVFGYTAAEAVGQPITILIPPDRLDEEGRILAKLRRGERVEHFETVRLTKGGRPLDISLTVSPIRDPEGDVIGASKVARDFTDRKRAEEALRESEGRHRLLADLAAVTQPLADPDAVMAATARLLGERLATTRCAYADVEPDNDAFTIRDDWRAAGVPTTAGTYSLDLFGPRAAADMRAGRKLVIRDVDAELARGDGADTFNAIGIKAIVCCPLVKEGLLRAMMAVHHATPRNWTDAEVALVQEVAERSWAHIERVRSAAALRESEARHAYLMTLTDTLRPLSDPLEIQAAASRFLGRHFGANRVLYFEIRGDEYVVERDYAAGVNSLVGRYRVADFGTNLLADFLAGRTVVEADATTHPGRPASERAAFAGIQVRGHVTVPFIRDGSFLAGIAVQFTTPHPWTAAEVVLIEDTAERTRAAVERAQAEAALRTSEERFRTLFETMDEGFVVIEVEFDPTGRAADYRHVEANPAFEKHTGLKDHLGKSVRQTVPGLEEFWFETYGRVATTGEPARFEHQAGPLDGRWFDVYASRLDGPGSTRVAVLFTDITARKRAEQERERLVGELREQDRRKDEFLATLAHELRNPLAPIRTGLQVMKLAPADAPEVGKARDMMERQLGHMVRLIDDLLDISRVSRGKLELRKERVDLRAVIETAVETARPLVDVGQHTLTVSLPDDPVWVDADHTRLAQVVSNVLTNAAKYTPDGGRITLVSRRHGDTAEVVVTDTGVGIPADMLGEVFDLFTQVNKTLERAQGGLGIGLALVQRLMEMHGGTITAASPGPNRGSTFTVCLPTAAPPTVVADDHPEHKSSRPAGRRVLVVDDNQDGAESLAMLLELGGHAARVAHDGPTALAAAREFDPQVVFLDIGMPGMNGYEVAKRFRADARLRGAVLIALTGWGSEDDKQRSRDAGFDFHLTKPVEPAAVDGVLARFSSLD